MHKDTTYKEKFTILQEWFPSIIEAVKKDLKNDHLRQDPLFCKQYFTGKNFNKLSVEELVPAYGKAIKESEKGEELAEFISNRWLFRNSELYDFFEKKLSQIDPNFTEIQEIKLEDSKQIISEAIQTYGAPATYLFCVLNSVVFPQEVYHDLSHQAKREVKQAEQTAKENEERFSLESLKQSYEEQIARLVDKYEKKLAGFQKKYTHDVDSLKKQIAHLQRKLSE